MACWNIFSLLSLLSENLRPLSIYWLFSFIYQSQCNLCRIKKKPKLLSVAVSTVNECEGANNCTQGCEDKQNGYMWVLFWYILYFIVFTNISFQRYSATKCEINGNWPFAVM